MWSVDGSVWQRRLGWIPKNGWVSSVRVAVDADITSKAKHQRGKDMPTTSRRATAGKEPSDDVTCERPFPSLLQTNLAFTVRSSLHPRVKSGPGVTKQHPPCRHRPTTKPRSKARDGPHRPFNRTEAAWPVSRKTKPSFRTALHVDPLGPFFPSFFQGPSPPRTLHYSAQCKLTDRPISIVGRRRRTWHAALTTKNPHLRAG